MKPTRQDLLDLTPEALAALANPGFVKRAQKDLAQGAAPTIEEDRDGSVSARYEDGHQATLASGRALREAQCSCPASGLCRHRVTLVLAYQQWAQARRDDNPASGPSEALDEVPWSPAEFDDAALAASLAPLVLSRAAKLAEESPVVRLLAWQAEVPVPSANLPSCTVRFFSRSSLAHARCDCREGSGCVHVALAVWAFREGERRQPGFVELRLNLLPPDHPAGTEAVDPREHALMAELDSLAWDIWQDGSSQSLQALEWRLRKLRNQAQALAWRWIDTQIETLEELLRAQMARSSQFRAEDLLHTLAGLHGRLQAAVHARSQARQGQLPALPAGEILGLGVPGNTELGHLRLVSLGAQYWVSSSEEGARLLYADPGSQAVLALERRWPREKDLVTLEKRRLLKQPLGKLAAGQILSKAARRAANGALNFFADARHTQILPLSPQSWDALVPPLRQSSANQLAAWLRAAQPDFVRPLQAAEHVHVVDVDGVHDWYWDPGQQTLHARLQCGDAEDDWLQLELPHSIAAEQAVDTLARTLEGTFGELRAVAGIVRLESGRPVMRPLAAVTGQRALSFHGDPAPGDAKALPVGRLPATGRPALRRCLELLLHWLRQGLRHQSTPIDSVCTATAQALAEAGWNQTAQLLRRLPVTLRDAEAKRRLPRELAGLALLVMEALTLADDELA